MTTASSDHPVWGEGVKTLRSIHRITQTSLATEARTTQATISRIEQGSRQVSDALRVRIARAFDVDPHTLFPYEDGDDREDGAA